jgi:hypothetical protein
VEEWIGILISAALGLLVYAISAAGSAALAFIWLPRVSRLAASLAASFLTPALMAATMVIIFLSDRGTPPARELAVVIAIVCAPGFVVGWPAAFLTLRGLERRLARAGALAQEIFE